MEAARSRKHECGANIANMACLLIACVAANRLVHLTSSDFDIGVKL